VVNDDLSRNGVLVEISDYIATVRLDRPPVNALSHEAYQAIATVFGELAARSDVRVCILTAAGKYFSAGRDFKSRTSVTAEERFATIGAALTAIRDCAVPVVAAVNGLAVGGGFGLVLACDLIVASTASSFGWPEINFGLVGGMAGSRGLLPPFLARRMYFTGEPVSPDRLCQLGVLESVVAPGQLAAEARRLAAVMAGKSPAALRAAKQAANEVETITDRQQAFRVVEARVGMAMTATEEHAEALRAFAEKRKPVFDTTPTAIKEPHA
jgi:enoyl-CoA hydratase